MKQLSLFFAAIAASITLSACTTLKNDQSVAAPGETITVKGGLTYLQKFVLPPGSVAEITVSDVSLADAPSRVIASQKIDLNGRQVPVAFELEIDRAQFEPRRRYSVRGIIRDGEDNLLWITDTMNPVDGSERVNDLGILKLVQVTKQADGPTSAKNAVYNCGDTRVAASFQGDKLRLNIDGRNYDLVRVLAASGARYEGRSTNEPVVFLG